MIKDKTILIKNIYYMLSYAFSELKLKEYEDLASEKFDSIHNLFAAILAVGTGRQLKQGLFREYAGHRENTGTLRGRIDMPGTVRNRLSRRPMLCCDFDELSENILLNRILKTAAMLLIGHDQTDRTRRDALKREMLFFSGVDPIDPKSVRWSAIRFHRNSGTYRLLIGLCRLLFEGMLLTTDAGECRLASFLDDQRMSSLYERFLRAYYAREHPGLSAAAAQIPWALDDGVDAMLPVMQSDITLSKGSTVLIIDAKYYSRTTQTQYDISKLHSANLYQIFAYVKNRDAAFGKAPHSVSGMLLYAATDESVQPDCAYRMSGNRISAGTLDLNRDFSDIRQRLDGIACEYFGPATKTQSAD